MTLRPEDIDALSLMEATDWLDKMSISYDLLETHDEILDLIRATVETERRQFADNEKTFDFLIEDEVMKSELSSFYDDLKIFVKENLGNELKTHLNNIYPDIDSRLERNKDDLINSDCAIVVAGETSAGKSSFLNLLIGTDVLPHSLLANTSAICQIHNSDQKRFKVVKENEECQTFTIDGDGLMSEKDFVKKLSPYINRSSSNRRDDIKHIDIYWPIPMLKERVTLVDTPGVGENSKMTEKLVKYLPNAVAFIYIVNSANAGGIQEDTILYIISEQMKLDTAQELSSFDPASMIFVCNKWDIVERCGMADDTWQDTVQRLQMTIPGLNEDHIFKLSVAEADRYRRSRIGNTEMYQHLLEGLKQFIPGSLIANIRRHYRWISTLLAKVEVYVASRIKNARKSSDEKVTFFHEVGSRLRVLERKSEAVRKRLTAAAQTECRHISQELHKRLSREDITSYLQTWTEEEAPDITDNDLDVTKFVAQEKILKRLVTVIQTWEKETRIVENATRKLTALFKNECLLLSCGCAEVDAIMTGSTLSDGMSQFLGEQSQTDVMKLRPSEIAIIAATSPIWVPIGIVVLAVIVKSIGDIFERKEYRKNKAEYMRKWALMLLKKLQTENSVSSLIETMYLKSMTDRINYLCSEFIPKQIKADKAQLSQIVNDQRTAAQIVRQFRPKKEKLKELFQTLYLFDLRHLAKDVIGISKILRYRQIGSGGFSDVYRATWKQENGDEKKVALKILKGHDVYLQLLEVECSRRLEHQNIVKFYGVIFAGSERYRGGSAGTKTQDIGLPLYDDRLMLVLELCDQSLESLVFGKTKLQCGSFSNAQRERETHRFFFKMAVSVCEGLAYMHRMQFLHRDLKLSNVLVKNGIGKVSDLGFARAEVIITGTAAGTLTHMAPELLNDKLYSFSSDIYSLGILLWELWYGKPSYTDSHFRHLSVVQFIDAVVKGRRPDCDTQHAMLFDLKTLVGKCLNSNPNDRPMIVEVTTELKQIENKQLEIVDNHF